MLSEEEKWDKRRESIIKSDVACQSFGNGNCDSCGISTKSVVRCYTCRMLFCHDCDENTHTVQPFHNRKMCQNQGTKVIALQPNQFFTNHGVIKNKGMSLLLLL